MENLNVSNLLIEWGFENLVEVFRGKAVIDFKCVLMNKIDCQCIVTVLRCLHRQYTVLLQCIFVCVGWGVHNSDT